MLSTIPIGAGAARMLDSTVTAVQKLAAAGLALAVVLRLTLRRKRP